MRLMRYIVVILTAVFSAVSSAEVATIPFDFSNRPKLGFFEKTWSHFGTGTVERIEYSIKRPYRQKLAIRVTDASGQTFQDDVPPASDTWVRHVKTMTAQWPLHFGGAKDGVMHHPIRDFRVLVLGKGKGEVSIRDVVFRERPPWPVPVVALRADISGAEPPTALDVEVKAAEGTFVGGRLAVEWEDWDGGRIAGADLAAPALASGQTWRASVPYAKRPAERNAILCSAKLVCGEVECEVEGPAWVAPVGACPTDFSKRDDVPWGTGIYLHRWGAGEKAYAQMERLAAAAEAAGIRWLREEIVWRQIERKSGQLDYSKYDRIMEIVERHGFRVCMLFGALSRDFANTDDDYPERYCVALRQAVRRYRGRIEAWEICNEPNLPWPMDPRWAANYRRLLPMATKVVHEEDSSARTVGCCASGLGVGFVKSLSDETFDDVSIHPYRRFVDAREFLADLAEVRSAGKGRDIWITEIGWHTFAPGFFGRKGKERPVTQQAFAALMARAHMVAAVAQGVRTVCGYDFVDDGVLAAGYEYHMGVVHGNVAPKPAYRALAKVFRLFRSGVPAMDIRSDGVCVFRMGGKCAVWTIGAERRMVVAFPAGIAASNLMDESVAPHQMGDKAAYVVDEGHPLFFEGQLLSVELVENGEANK